MAKSFTLRLTRAELCRLADAVEYTLEHEGLVEADAQLSRLYDRLNDELVPEPAHG